MIGIRRQQDIQRATAGLFVAATLLFWALYYPHHLHHQEQLQLFLFTPEYAADKWAHPGGVGEYIGEFLTQFFLFSWAGATIIALLLLGIQRQLAGIARTLGAQETSYPLSFLPSLLIGLSLCDEHTLLSFPVSLLGALLAFRIYQAIPSRRAQIPYALGMIPLLYGAIGGLCWLFLLGVALDTLQKGHCRWLPAYLLAGILGPLLAWERLHYPLFSLLTGINYYRYPGMIPGSLTLAALASLVTPIGMVWLSRLPIGGKFRQSLLYAGIFVGGGGAIYAASDPVKEELMRYDYLTRQKQWEAIIQQAERRSPTTPFSVACLNLALAKSGQLGDRMFHFYQNGIEGLIPSFQRDFVSPLPASELFYHLGMINSSQRYTFEAMEAIPDYKKSGRAYQRLAETNLINGQYAVAAKYLRALQKTLFYRSWATEALSYLGDEARIDQHPEWGWLRKVRYTTDFLFSETEIDQMLGLLVQQNPKNRMAFEYLLAYTLQQRDPERFLRYYPLGKEMGYDHIPRSYQEALVFVWTQRHPNFRGLPWSIHPEVLEGISEFARIYTSKKEAEALLRPKYEKTFWYYFLFRK